MLLARLEPAISLVERTQVHALDRATTGIGRKLFIISISLEWQHFSMI
jgi:hypothetical protein